MTSPPFSDLTDTDQNPHPRIKDTGEGFLKAAEVMALSLQTNMDGHYITESKLV